MFSDGEFLACRCPAQHESLRLQIGGGGAGHKVLGGGTGEGMGEGT